MLHASELRDKTTEDLKERLTSLELHAFRMKFQLATEQLTKTAELRAAKRDLARVRTVLRERELGMHSAPEGTGAAESGEE